LQILVETVFLEKRVDAFHLETQPFNGEKNNNIDKTTENLKIFEMHRGFDKSVDASDLVANLGRTEVMKNMLDLMTTKARLCIDLRTLQSVCLCSLT